MSLCKSVLNGSQNIGMENDPFVFEENSIDYKDMTYVQIEEKLAELKELDDRYEESDRILQKWEIHDEIEYKIKHDFFLVRSKKSLLETCDNFTNMTSFYGIIQLNDRVKMIEIREKKANEHLK